MTTGTRASTTPGSGGWRSPDAHAAASTTVGSSSRSTGASGGGPVARDGGAQLGGAGPHGRGGIGQPGGQVVRGHPPGPGQRAEGGGPHGGHVVAQVAAGLGHVAPVSGQGRGTAAGHVVG